MEVAMDEHALWADLDAVDPRSIDDYPPTIAWETSPGRFQALWIISGGDMQGASWHGGENQRLTYHLGADASGWDTTQLLRIPGWKNYKPEYREQYGEPPQGRLLWSTGRRYLPDEFEDLPEVQTQGEIQTILEDEINAIDRREVWGRVRLKLPHRAREQFAAKEASGDRSEQLWWMMRCLADVGCTATEIVALVRPTVWNKFEGRHDELKRLTIEASKAIAQRSEEVSDQLEEEREERPDPMNLFDLVENVPQPEWIVTEILSAGACGFIAGEPKTYKSWLALDMVLSVSTGIPFLDHFSIRRPGPVLYIQEEDSASQVKRRLAKIWPGKQGDKMQLAADNSVVWVPPNPQDKPKINALIRGSMTISDGGWQAWLDEQLDRGYNGDPYVLLVIDPLMMVAGDVEENRSQEMTTKIYRPLKVLAEKHKCAVLVVHHMKKNTNGGRGGQMMLGSVANHAWAEDSLYLRLGRGGIVSVERESKHTTTGRFKISRLRNSGWTPTVSDDRTADDDDPGDVEAQPSDRPRRNGIGTKKVAKIHKALDELGPGKWTTKQVAEQMGSTQSGAYRQLVRLADSGKVKKADGAWVVGNESS